mmetsp:Transcript_30469/g.97229  ORF Transcript_30469/g.97229 Transcript_30469/m.97229 type:complete len:277 (-) Transcript_30469:197-1027(-)
MSSLCFVLGLGGSKGQVRMHILASRMSFSICGCENSLSTTMPWMSSVSSSEPPGLPSTLIMSKFTSWRSMSATLSTASTAMRAILSLCTLMILDESVVLAVCTSGSVSSAVKFTTSEMSARCRVATSQAFSKPSATRTGWMPRSSSRSACSSSAPASTTTPVVPSPISSSWERDSSTSSRATWCSTSIFSRMVAPSFDTVTSPSGFTSILSMPLGPSDVRSTDDTDRAARMFAFCAARPFTRAASWLSLRMTNGRPYSSKTTPWGFAAGDMEAMDG